MNCALSIQRFSNTFLCENSCQALLLCLCFFGTGDFKPRRAGEAAELSRSGKERSAGEVPAAVAGEFPADHHAALADVV